MPGFYFRKLLYPRHCPAASPARPMPLFGYSLFLACPESDDFVRLELAIAFAPLVSTHFP